MSEVSRTFTCFGGATTVAVEGSGPEGDAQTAVQRVIDLLLDLHATFSRFKPESELCRLNGDPRDEVPVSPMMLRFVQEGLRAAEATDGLVDFTLLGAIEATGYRDDKFRGSLALPLAVALAPPRRPAAAAPEAGWRQVATDGARGTVARPAGVRFDGGGIVKGLAADVVAELLHAYPSFAVDCEGDLRVGGAEAPVRVLEVANPFSGAPLHEFEVKHGSLATSNIAKRSWLASMRPTHHVLDPATGTPAFTGVVQASALAPTAAEGEALAKAALLAGPEQGLRWLRHGGVLVRDDGSHAVVPPS